MAERPIECSHCQKAIDVTYKELANGTSLCTQMCSDCPILEKKLHGKSESSNKPIASEEIPKLCCAICMTTLESIQTGNPLGCNHCYIVFEQPLLGKLLNENLLSPCIQQEIKELSSSTIHRGKTPHQPISIPFSNQLATLSEALNGALQKEQYEQAAWLRDQIKELKEKASERKE